MTNQQGGDAQIHNTDSPSGDSTWMSNQAAEIAVIGAILFNNAAFARVDHLRKGHFHYAETAALFEEISNRIRAGATADGVMLRDWARKHLTTVGGDHFLTTCLDSAAFGPEIEDYALDLSRRAVKRSGVTVLEEAVSAFKRSENPAEVIDGVERSLRDLQGYSGDKWRWLDADPNNSNIFKPWDISQCIPSGYAGLDKVLGGFRRDAPTVIAGRPGMGKSMIGVNLARKIAERGVGVGVYSLEMGADMYWLRMSCDKAFEMRDPFLASGQEHPWDSPYYSLIKRGDARTAHLEAAKAAYADICRLPLKIDERAGLPPTEMHRWARRLAGYFERRNIELGAIIIDHLQCVNSENNRGGNKVAEMTDISAAMKEIAKDLNVAVIELCQLNRGVEGRPDKRPMLSDLRESGALEQDAGQVLLLYREAYYLERKFKEDGALDADEYEKLQQVKWRIEVDVAKNRDDATGRVDLRCVPGANAITDLEMGTGQERAAA